MTIRYLTITVLLLTSCGFIVKDNQLQKADWLLGTWEMKTPRGSVYETWEITGDNQLSGMSYMLNGTDTAVFERIRLVVEQDEIFYIPAVSNQNDGKEVRFRGSSISESELVFENPEHDFPQKIKYSLIRSDSLVAEISGEVNGQMRNQLFPMKKR